MQRDRIIIRLGALLWAIIAVALYLGREWAAILLWAVFS